MESVLGKACESFALASMLEYRKIIPGFPSKNPGTQDAISRTVLVVSLLTLHFPSCRDLWTPMDQKARHFLSSNLRYDDLEQMEEFATPHLAKVTFHLRPHSHAVLPPEDADTAWAPGCDIPILLPNSGTSSSSTATRTPGSRPPWSLRPPRTEPPNMANQERTSPSQPHCNANLWAESIPAAPAHVLNPTTPLRKGTTSQPLPHDGVGSESVPASSSDGEVYSKKPKTTANLPRFKWRSASDRNADKKAVTPAASGLTNPDSKVVKRTPPSSDIQVTSVSEHENLIKRIAAEREARSVLGGEEAEIPEDL